MSEVVVVVVESVGRPAGSPVTVPLAEVDVLETETELVEDVKVVVEVVV